MICLDTNVVIGVLNRRGAGLKARFDREIDNGSVALPAVSLFELEFGIAKSQTSASSRLRLAEILRLPLVILPFEAADAREAADIRATLFRAGTPIGPYDVLIAAQARCRGATARHRQHPRVRAGATPRVGGLDGRLNCPSPVLANPAYGIGRGETGHAVRAILPP